MITFLRFATVCLDSITGDFHTARRNSNSDNPGRGGKLMNKQNDSPRKPAFRNDIQGLRGVAIIAVLLFHFRFGGASGGFLGVDIFFVISGFLITTILQKNTDRPFSRNLLTFYGKRFWRIFPACIVVILASLAAGWLILLPEDLARLGRSSIFSALFASDFFFFGEAGYFDLSGIFKPLLHTWSLAVEMQFYAIWPFLLLWFSSTGKLSLTKALVLFFILMFAGSTALSIGDPENAFFMMYSRLWEFAAGAIVALALSRRPPCSSTVLAGLFGWLAMILLIISFFTVSNDMLLPAPGALLAVLATAGLIGLGSASPATFRLLSFPPLVWIGEISYSLYLVHWPLIVYISYLLYPQPSFATRALALAACLPLAFLLYRFVEVPFRDRGKKQPFAPVLVGTAIATLAFVLITGQFVLVRDGVPERFAAPTLAALDRIEPHPGPQVKWQGGETLPVTSPKIVLWGDSHALHFKNTLAREASAAGYRLQTLAAPSCPPIYGVYLKRHTLSIAKGCYRKNRKALYSILRNPHIAIVILAARWSFYAETRRFGGEAGGRAFLTDSKWAAVSVSRSRSHFAGGLRNTVQRLVDSGKRVILLGQVPEFGFDPPRCIKMSLVSGIGREVCTISIAKMRQRQKFAEQVMEKIASASSKVRFFRTSGPFCNNSVCSPLVSGQIAYSDDDHINPTGADTALQNLRLPHAGAVIPVSDRSP